MPAIILSFMHHWDHLIENGFQFVFHFIYKIHHIIQIVYTEKNFQNILMECDQIKFIFQYTPSLQSIQFLVF